MSIIETLVQQFPIRKSRKQKAAFREWAVQHAQDMGYAARVETSALAANVIIGDPETADVTFTAHYDTPAVMPLPNFITPCNVLVYILYQVVMSVVMLAPGIALGALAGYLAGGSLGPEGGFSVGYFVIMALMFLTVGLMMMGPANKHNVNDNTSGVAAVLEMMQKLPEAQRAKAAFILFDNEEKGMLGSGAYASRHKPVHKEKLIINLDCVGDGEHILFFANKKTRALPCFPHLEEAMKDQNGRHFVMNQMEKCVYPSDQSNFKLGIAVCACNQNKRVGYYCDKIHTKKDTICRQENLDFLSDGLIAFVDTL